MTRIRIARPLLLAMALLVTVWATGPTSLRAQEAAIPDAAAKVVEVTVEGNSRVDTNTILAQMRLRKGAVYTPAAANEDFKRIYALRHFDNVVITPQPVTGGVRLVVTVTESRLLSRIEFVGAHSVSEKKLRSLVELTEGDPLDRQRLRAAVPLLMDEFKRGGHNFVQVALDEELMKQQTVARYTISEGPKVRVTKVTFRGNASLSANELQKQIETKAALPGVLGKLFGPYTFSEPTLAGDVARIRSYYVAQGFFDAQVSRELRFNDKNEKVTIDFLVEEGLRYRVASVAVTGTKALSAAYLAENLSLRTGEFYTADAMKADSRFIHDSYGRVGYVHAFVAPRVVFTDEPGTVDVIFTVTEDRKITIGEIIITGNATTQDKVVLRELGLEPMQVADAQQIDAAQKRLVRTQIFRSADITLLPTDDPNVENLAVHVEEGQTAQFIIGAGVSSNSGLIGNISLKQRNFDLTRWPRSWNDPGAFRGAGQTARIVLEPGTERQQYSIGITEPAFFDKPIRFDASAAFYTRERDSYEEQRFGGQFSFGKGLARNIRGSLGLRLEMIDITDIDATAPPDVMDVQGNSFLSAVSLSISRDMTDNYFVPTTGSRLTATIEQAGIVGGDYTFTKFLFDGRRYWTVTEDALGRRSVFSLKGRVGFAPGDPPIFERFYAGGQGTIRGFEFRGVGPVVGNDAVGGDFMLLLSAEYQFPIVGKNFSGVVFLDSGTVEDGISIGTYRASTGFGIRFTVDMMGAPVPFALDFGFPLAKDKDDETQVFSFSIAWSF
jgi:outer membrane protein insertion porin family